MTILVLPGAERDIKEAINFYDETSIELGEFLVSEFEKCLELIEENPRIGREGEDSVRKFPLGRFPCDIVCSFLDGDILGIAVAHQRRILGQPVGSVDEVVVAFTDGNHHNRI